MISCQSLFRAKEHSLRAVLTGLSFTSVLKRSGGSSHTFKRIVTILSQETAELSDWFGYQNNSDTLP